MPDYPAVYPAYPAGTGYPTYPAGSGRHRISGIRQEIPDPAQPYFLREVVATNCNTHLGGEDFLEHFIKLYKKKKDKDLRKDSRAVQKLRRKVEKAKRALSVAHQVICPVDMV